MTRGHLGAGLRFALAHHPTCSRFRSHVVVLRAGRRQAPLCAGCVAFWPALLAGAPLAFTALAHGAVWWAVLATGLALGSAQLASYAGLLRRRGGRMAAKAAFGLGAAAVLAALWAAPWPVWSRLALGGMMAAALLGLHSLRFRRMQAVCAACPWAKAWEACPGFAPFNGHRPGLAPPRPTQEALPHAWPWPRETPDRP